MKNISSSFVGNTMPIGEIIDNPPEYEKQVNIDKFVKDRLEYVFEVEKSQKAGEEKQETEKKRVYILKHNQELPDNLPPGYCYIGGVARNTLFREMGEKTNPPRDTDVVAIAEMEPNEELIEEVSATHMQDDYKKGHKVRVETFEEYFNSRDFTLNEVIVDGEYIYVSEDALEAIKTKTIRPTEYRSADTQSKTDSEKWGVDPQLAAKALRLQVEMEDLYGEANIEGIESWQWEFPNMKLVSLSLALSKATELGDQYSAAFYAKLLELGTIEVESKIKPIGGESLKELAANIRFATKKDPKRKDNPFEFAKEALNTMRNDSSNKDPEWQTYKSYADIANDYLDKDPWPGARNQAKY